MFTDLNKNAVKTSKSLDVLFDHRDIISRVTTAVIDLVPAFKDRVETETASLPVTSTKMFSLAALYDANQELIGGRGTTRKSPSISSPGSRPSTGRPWRST